MVRYITSPVYFSLITLTHKVWNRLVLPVTFHWCILHLVWSSYLKGTLLVSSFQLQSSGVIQLRSPSFKKWLHLAGCFQLFPFANWANWHLCTLPLQTKDINSLERQPNWHLWVLFVRWVGILNKELYVNFSLLYIIF